MRIGFVFPPFLVAGRPLDFPNFWEDKRGSTGSEIQVLAMAKEMAARGHDVELFIEGPNATQWEGVRLRELAAVHDASYGFDVVAVSIDFNVFRGLSKTPLRVCFQQINGFEYGQSGFDEFVDVYVSPSENHKEFLKNGGWSIAPEKWEVIPNGCYPNEFLQDMEKREHVMIWASSPDRGLHLALQEYPKLKQAVPDLELHIYYWALPRFIAEWQGYGPDQPQWPGWQRELSRRALYVAKAFEKLQPFGVKVIGATSRRQMAREMAGAGVLAFPCDTISYCVAGDTLIDTDKGFYKIEDMARVEARVASLAGAYAPTCMWADSGVHPTIEVTTAHGFRVRGTRNHPLLVATGGLDLEWRRLDALRVGDRLVINRAPGIFPNIEPELPFLYKKPARGRWPEKKTVPSTMTPDLATVLGYLVAEGCVRIDKIDFINKDNDVIEDFARAFGACFPDTKLHRFACRRGLVRFEIHAQYVIKFLHFCGLLPKKSGWKTVPEFVLKGTKRSVACFIAAYAEGDGGIAANSVILHSTSGRLLAELQTILVKFGVTAVLRRNTRPTPNYQMNRLAVSDRTSLTRFETEIGFTSERKTKALAGALASTTHSRPQLDRVPYAMQAVLDFLAVRRVRVGGGNGKHGLYRDDDGLAVEFCRTLLQRTETRHGLGLTARKLRTLSPDFANKLERFIALPYLFDPIVSIESRPAERVYDLSVPGPRAFTGNGILCHNTEGFSCATMEAAAAGCLPIISPVDALGSIYGGAVPMTSGRPRDCMPEWRELVIRALTDRAWATEWRAKARALADQHHWGLVAGKLEAMLERRIAEKKARIS